jgi:putative transposase
VRKTWKELKRREVEVGRDRVARLMRAEGLEGVRRGKKRRTTISDEPAVERARDLVQRDFSASAPNEKWVADITYLRTWNGFIYLAFILDCYSRMIVGWQLATHLRTDLARELVDERRFPSFEHAEHETLDWIGFYNEERLHEELGDLPPAEYEELNIKTDNSQTLAAR